MGAGAVVLNSIPIKKSTTGNYIELLLLLFLIASYNRIPYKVAKTIKKQTSN